MSGEGTRWASNSAAAIIAATRQHAAGSLHQREHRAHVRLISEHLKWTFGGGASYPARSRAIKAYADSMSAYTALANALAGPAAPPAPRHPPTDRSGLP
jgi:hypothetical protein